MSDFIELPVGTLENVATTGIPLNISSSYICANSSGIYIAAFSVNWTTSTPEIIVCCRHDNAIVYTNQNIGGGPNTKTLVYNNSYGYYTSYGNNQGHIYCSGNGEIAGLTTHFSTVEELLTAFQNLVESYPITYRLTNCSAPSAPAEAEVGDTVNVPLVLQQGYDIITPSTDIVVTNNGVVVPHTYSNGTISFTMPDPS